MKETEKQLTRFRIEELEYKIEELEKENEKFKQQIIFDEKIGELVMQNVESRFRSWFSTVTGIGPFK